MATQYNPQTDKALTIMPKVRTVSRDILPCGSGRPRVRVMRASISESYHIFSAPAAPAPAAIHIMMIAPETQLICPDKAPGAQIKPTKAVKTTRLITRGFINAKKSDGSARLRLTGVSASFISEAAPLSAAAFSDVLDVELAFTKPHSVT